MPRKRQIAVSLASLIFQKRIPGAFWSNIATQNPLTSSLGIVILAVFRSIDTAIDKLSKCHDKHIRAYDPTEVKIIRILHECEVLIEKSVPRVTVWHHEAPPSDAKL